MRNDSTIYILTEADTMVSGYLIFWSCRHGPAGLIQSLEEPGYTEPYLQVSGGRTRTNQSPDPPPRSVTQR